MPSRKRNQPLQSTIGAPWAEPLTPLTQQTSQENDAFIFIQDIHLPSQQPRRYFDPQALAELVSSIQQHGILQPLLVRPRDKGGYELVAGERRYRAATQAQLTEVPVIIRDLADEQAWQLALIENLQREDLNPVEETEGILQLLSIQLNYSLEEVTSLLYKLQNEAKGKVTRNVTGNEIKEQVEAVFDSLGHTKWESFVRNRLPLLKLPEDILTALREGKIAYTKATIIGRVKDEEIRQQILTEAISEDLSLSDIRERIRVLTAQPESPSNANGFPQRLKVAYQQITQQKIWDDPDKRSQLEQLLGQLEALVQGDE